MATAGNKPRRFRWLTILVASSAAALGFSIWHFVFYPQWKLRTWYQEVETRILRLAAKRPEGVSPSEWAYYLHWTWNLHTNWGPYFAPGERDRFLADFDRMLNEKVDIGTVDWVWDQYVEYTTGGRRYSRSFRPTNAEVKRTFYEGQSEGYDLQWWLNELRRRDGPFRGTAD